MAVHNADVARIFRRVADLLAIEGANEFRGRAYRLLEEMATCVTGWSKSGGVVEPGRRD